MIYSIRLNDEYTTFCDDLSAGKCKKARESDVGKHDISGAAFHLEHLNCNYVI
eukprot:m.38492 g.38492  ORF g.38492 m.38492 type:complete len:53 (+) comp9442_c0_seq1:511-669(+)